MKSISEVTEKAVKRGIRSPPIGGTMNKRAEATPGFWSTLKKWILGVAGVLFVMLLPINEAIDVYNKMPWNIPRTEAERINNQLFEKHFNKSALVTIPVPIKTDAGTVDMKLSVYDGGDIFAEYGNNTRWFPFPQRHTR